MFNSNHVVVVVVVYGLRGEGNFFHCGVVGFNPLEGPDRGYFLHYWVVVFQPLAGTCSIIFHNS